jgi:hypothetical protein
MGMKVTTMGWAAALAALLDLAAAGADIEVIDGRTPWRAQLASGMDLVRGEAGLRLRSKRRSYAFDPANPDPKQPGFGPMPPAEWIEADFDDRHWARYLADDLADYLGGYGGDGANALLCLRTRFGVSDPEKVSGLKITVTCLGGGVVYVNGREIGRGFMPDGAVYPSTPATDYPIEAYTTEDGKTPLPFLGSGGKPEAKWLKRYEQRIRTFSLDIPPDVLRKGGNVLAVSLRRAPRSGPVSKRGSWAHMGFDAVRLTVPERGGVIPYAEALKGPRVWSAEAFEQVTARPSKRTLVRKSWFWTLLWSRGMPVKGVQVGNPFDPVRPVRMLAPRNGVCSGQAVLSDADGLREIAADLDAFAGPDGAAMPASAAQVRFAVQTEGLHYCDALMPSPPQDAVTVPVWTVVTVPRDQRPGWYRSTLRLRANGKRFEVPLQVLVTGLTVPDARSFRSTISFCQSPETVAMQYGVEPWSKKHLALLETSLELLGQVGNDVIYVPVILGHLGGAKSTRVKSHRLPMIWWERTPDGLRPDFSGLDAYLDLYARHCAPPKAVSLYIWGHACAREMVSAYEGGGKRKGVDGSEINKDFKAPRVWVRDPETGAMSEQEVPVIGGEGSEAFWKPLVDGVRDRVVRHGWPERVVMLGLGGDERPGAATTALFREWTPYARWNYLSHFSGDPPAKDGKLIATGGGEVGLKEWPWIRCATFLDAKLLEARLLNAPEFVELPTGRWLYQDYSPPFHFRTLPLMWSRLGRLGLDFWMGGQAGKPRATSFIGGHVNALTVPGPDGALPTVRFQLFREGVQDAEVRTMLIRAYLALPEEQRAPYRELLDALPARIARRGMPEQELNRDWPGYAARLYRAAAELCGSAADARWEQPPAVAGE